MYLKSSLISVVFLSGTKKWPTTGNRERTIHVLLDGCWSPAQNCGRRGETCPSTAGLIATALSSHSDCVIKLHKYHEQWRRTTCWCNKQFRFCMFVSLLYIWFVCLSWHLHVVETKRFDTYLFQFLYFMCSLSYCTPEILLPYIILGVTTYSSSSIQLH